MATHDYVIDNSTGANVRADINNVLQAILTNNSSSSAPSTTAAYMWWADTTNGVLKIRNSANDGWVELLQLDGTITLEDGSASTPALAFRDDLDTGIFSGGANQLQIATGGTERVEFKNDSTIFNDGGADVDFRIEGDTDANLFSLNGGTDKIGIGTSSAGLKLHIQDGALASAPTPNSNCDVVIEGTDNTGIQFLSATQVQLRFGDAASTAAGSIIYQHNDNNFRLNYSDFLSFNNGSGEVAQLDSSGNCGIGTSNPLKRLHIASAGDVGLMLQTTNAVDDKEIWEITCAGNASNQAELIFRTRTNAGSGGIEAMRIDDQGRIGIGTDDPSAQLHLAAANPVLQLTGTNAGNCVLQTDGADLTLNVDSGDAKSNSAIAFRVDNSEKMSIQDDGDVLIGTTSGVQNGRLEVRSDKTSASTVTFANTNSSYVGTVMLLHAERETTNNSYEFLNCRIESPNPGVQAFRLEVGDDGDVRNVNGTYTTISDISLKENIVDANSQWDDFKNLKFRSFNFKESTGFSTHKQIGLVAQEAETVCPNLVKTGKPDANTKETHKFVKTSILYMKGMKALQEAIAKIEVLETKVAALEAG